MIQGCDFVVFLLLHVHLYVFLLKPLPLQDLKDQLLLVLLVRFLWKFEIFGMVVHPWMSSYLLDLEPLRSWGCQDVSK